MTDFEATPTDRYSRHRLIDWWDQDKLATANVLVVGAGALGNEAIKNLALLGIGHITILDFDRVDVSNLSRSVLFRPTDVGRWKADVAAEAASLLNADTTITPIVGDLEFSIGIGELREYSVILGCLDSINARWALNRLSFAAGVPWINAGINPTAGEISLFVPDDGACYECAMSDAMWQRFNERYSCNKLLRELPPRTFPTTITLAALTASLQVQEALTQIHGPTERSGLRPGQKAYFSVKPYTFFIVDLPKNPDCLAHETTRIDISMHASPQDIALADVFQHLDRHGMRVDAVDLRYDVLTSLECPTCGPDPVFVPLKLASPSLATCPVCHSQRLPILASKFSPEDPAAHLPLSRLGCPPRCVLTFVSESGTVGVELTKSRGATNA